MMPAKEKFKKFSLLINIVTIISFAFLFLTIYNTQSFGNFDWVLVEILRYCFLIVSVAIVSVYLFYLKKNVILDAFLLSDKTSLIISIIIS